MPVKNYFPVFHKLKSGAYSYVWTDKCEKLLPAHYKQRCLDYMTKDPKPVHWRPDTTKYKVDEYGTRLPIQNHPIHVRYPVQCNYGLWGGEGVVEYWAKVIKSRKYIHVHSPLIAKYSVPFLVDRVLYSEILDKWFKIPCTNRAMDLIDDSFGLDYYILQTHERDLNSKLAMDLKREMLLQLCKDEEDTKLPEKRKTVLQRYSQFIIPKSEAEWVGLSIKEALDKAEQSQKRKPIPLKKLIAVQYLKELKEYKESEDNNEGEEEELDNISDGNASKPESKPESKGWLSFLNWGKSQKQQHVDKQ
ncbi:large ribosomal subunit protein bL28m-like [Ruditapes philippinarum]|uniref:large ribosomal subunit protein bL28m-like n=1 Tax=Ruditapes philippinarum TaxID=129788 RepID=UPI00295A6D10|nr:large ribosomal subunit protein bL28m-like [Ruditapes philippinarum]